MPPTIQDSVPDSGEWEKRGDALLEKGKYTEAIEAYRQIRATDPEYLAACNRIGNALAQLGREEEALAEFKKIIELRPDNPLLADVALNNAVHVLRNLGRENEALALFRRVLDEEPDNAMALTNMGNLLSDLSGRRKRSRHTIKRLPSSRTTQQYMPTKGMCSHSSTARLRLLPRTARRSGRIRQTHVS
ncbi:MAG: tetratricopeptide repeat protein [Methanomicrobiaceae archaeon]|nr:tetratricopeptide repeat protein [Methanomicrobiaceae archaeon]